MDQESPMVDTVNQAADPWSDKAEDLVREFARTQNAIAGHHSAGVTFPGETADMNAPLVNAVRHAKTLEFVLDLNGLADNIRRMEDRASLVRARQAQRDRQEAYQQGVADGVEKGRAYAKHEQDAAAENLAHGNAEDRVIRSTLPVTTPKGHVAAWHHHYEDGDGNTFLREVYGVLGDDVREGDTRAVIVAGPDQHLISLDRVRFAPTLAALVAQRDIKLLTKVEILTDENPATVRVRDDLDTLSRADVSVVVVTPEEVSEEMKPGTYVRFVTEGSERTVIDISKERWMDLVHAVETLYARQLVANAEGEEK